MSRPVSRSEVRAGAGCPACLSEPGAWCVGARGRLRESNHAERIVEFLESSRRALTGHR